MVVGALVAVQSDGVAWQLDDLEEVRGKTSYWFSSLSNLLYIHMITKALVWCIKEQSHDDGKYFRPGLGRHWPQAGSPWLC